MSMVSNERSLFGNLATDFLPMELRRGAACNKKIVQEVQKTLPPNTYTKIVVTDEGYIMDPKKWTTIFVSFC